MTLPILVTKLFIPATRPERVTRSRLIERLDEGINRKLTLVSAPAGFGKSTLVTEWITQKGDNALSPFCTAWVSLDENDNDPVRFLTYLVEALNRLEGIKNGVGASALAMLRSPQPPPSEIVLTALINEIAGLECKVFLVLDDYHLIDESAIHSALTFLLENLPPQLHLVIATREDPLLPLSRLRARNQITELRATDLRFTPAEAADFLNQVMGLNLSDEDIAALETRTEGWIAGLQLAAISMQGREDATIFIQSFTGSNRLVLDYLIEEVLERQSTEIQDFLLQTAILDRLTGPLCNSVTKQEHREAILESLDRANLFIVPLDNERQWYRYHHLFGELLAQRLRFKYPDLINELHARAVTWYEDNGFLSQAIQHAFAGDDIHTAVRLIEKGSLDALERSDFGFILNAVKRIPVAVLENSPWLFVYHCWALLLTGQIAIVAPKFENTAWLLDSISEEDETQISKMSGYIAGLKVQLSAWQRDFKNTTIWANQANTYLPDSHWIRAYCAMMVGVSNWDTGNLAAAFESFQEAASIGEGINNKRVAVTSAIYLGHALELMGQLKQGAQVYQNAFEFARQKSIELPVACYLHIDLARILCEQNELDQAIQHLSKGIQQSQLLADDRIENIGYGLLTRVYLASGDCGNALNSIHNWEKFIPSPGIIYDMRGGEYPKVRLWLKQKKLNEIEVWLQNHPYRLDHSIDFKTRMTYTMHARVMVTLARDCSNDDLYLAEAQNLLAALFDLAESNGWGSRLIEILVLQSLALDLAGERTSALAKLERALTLAEPEGFVRVFVDEGPPMARLLYEALSQGIATNYVQHLLAAFPEVEPEQIDQPKIQSSNGEWIEALSERELEILQLISDGLTNREIAAKLYLSLNTVKAHTRSIYGKLDVNNRTQAAARARALGLITTD